MVLKSPIVAGLAVAGVAPQLAAARSPDNPSYNGEAILPALGWDNWNSFGCDVSEDLLLGSAEKIVDYGLKDLGYQYVVLDDCWSVGREENGSLKADPAKFPNGMAHVASKLHGMGLKFGMYSSAGYLTCAKYDGSLGKEEIDAQTFADWGVDYLKYDNCYNGGQAGTQYLSYTRYKVMSDALAKTGRKILYSLCNWGEDGPWNWAQTMANSWRMSGDVTDNFSRPDPRCPCTGDETSYVCVLPGFHCSILNIMNKMAAIVSKTQSGAQSDMDALEVGNGGMSDGEYKVQFSIWAINSSPLLMGNDLRKMDAPTLSILSNPAIIALNQDPTVRAATRVWRHLVDDKDEWGQGETNLWVRPLNNSDLAVALVNAGNATRNMEATLADILYDSGGVEAKGYNMGYDVYDLWANRMDDTLAGQVLNGTAPEIGDDDTARYNATRSSYAEGLKANATALMGKKIGTVEPMGTLMATVERRDVGLFRLRPNGKTVKDEL